MDKGICKLFERGIKLASPTTNDIVYEVSDLLAYMDALFSLKVLIAKPVETTADLDSPSYSLKDREWLKAQLILHLQKQVTSF